MKLVVYTCGIKRCHFENTTALNYPIKKGDKIEGFRDVDLKLLLEMKMVQNHPIN
jgi:hypothetical protein